MASANVSVKVDDSGLRKLLATLQKTGNPVRIVADGVEYGVHQEFGTSRGVPATMFMTRAVEKHRNELTQAIKQAGGDFTMLENAVVKVAFDVERDAKDNAPVDTGALRNSIHVIDPGRDYSFTIPGR